MENKHASILRFRLRKACDPVPAYVSGILCLFLCNLWKDAFGGKTVCGFKSEVLHLSNPRFQKNLKRRLICSSCLRQNKLQACPIICGRFAFLINKTFETGMLNHFFSKLRLKNKSTLKL